jgi:hypothetical protein
MSFIKKVTNHYRVLAGDDTNLVNEVKKALSEQKKSLLKMKSNIEKHNITNWMGEDVTNINEMCDKVVFENDVVEKILKKHGYHSVDDIELGGKLRDMQHDMIDEVCM